MKTLHKYGYEVVRELGRGATAYVYLVRHTQMKRYCACKIGLEGKSLKQESEILKMLQHPLFPRWIDFWESKDRHYLFMEYVSGCSLRQLLNRRNFLTITQSVHITIKIADGLAYLHEKEPMILFRDLKPSNIMIQENGRVRLIDLGGACLTKKALYGGEKVGTPGYAAPEQLISKGYASIQSDVYGLAAILKEMVDEKKAKRLNRVVTSCLAVNREERIPNMREFIRQLSWHENNYKCLNVISRNKQELYYIKNVWKSAWEEVLEH